eukprot:TRINITY_DN137_c1_g3_i2.p1 TRINITY_DN137_c1_g3~~TRINITY_DN137_c1_g3_i2.p1  ORF type:complete len:931 (+),score=211.07 TRINITY_DN137_c1_g3_i2:131-2923(+)
MLNKEVTVREYPNGFEKWFDMCINPKLSTFIPECVHPNYITTFGAFCLAMAFTSSNPFLISAFLAIYGIADCLDGHHARKTNQSSSCGALLSIWLEGLTIPLTAGILLLTLESSDITLAPAMVVVINLFNCRLIIQQNRQKVIVPLVSGLVSQFTIAGVILLHYALISFAATEWLGININYTVKLIGAAVLLFNACAFWVDVKSYFSQHLPMLILTLITAVVYLLQNAHMNDEKSPFGGPTVLKDGWISPDTFAWLMAAISIRVNGNFTISLGLQQPFGGWETRASYWVVILSTTYATLVTTQTFYWWSWLDTFHYVLSFIPYLMIGHLGTSSTLDLLHAFLLLRMDEETEEDKELSFRGINEESESAPLLFTHVENNPLLQFDSPKDDRNKDFTENLTKLFSVHKAPIAMTMKKSRNSQVETRMSKWTSLPPLFSKIVLWDWLLEAHKGCFPFLSSIHHLIFFICAVSFLPGLCVLAYIVFGIYGSLITFCGGIIILKFLCQKRHQNAINPNTHNIAEALMVTPPQVNEHNDKYTRSESIPPNTIQFFTCNAFMRPPGCPPSNGFFVDEYKVERLQDLADHCKNFDVVCLQEMFATGSLRQERLLHAFLNLGFRYFARSPTPRFRSPIQWVDGGLMIVSKYPITSSSFHCFDKCSGADRLANKGILHCSVKLGTSNINVFTAHLQASECTSQVNGPRPYPPEAGIRLGQCDECIQFIHKITSRHQGPTVLLGDFNVDSRGDPMTGFEHSKEYLLMMKSFEGSKQNLQYRATDCLFKTQSCHPITFGDICFETNNNNSRSSNNNNNKELTSQNPISIKNPIINNNSQISTTTTTNNNNNNNNKSIILPLETGLTGKNEQCALASLDYVIHLENRDPHANLCSKIEMKHIATCVDKMMIDDRPYIQLSDHYGVLSSFQVNYRTGRDIALLI